MPDRAGNEWAGTLEVYTDGTVAKVKFNTDYRAEGEMAMQRAGGIDIPGRVVEERKVSPRGSITKFSRKSRQRQMVELGKLDLSAAVLMTTLTYPGRFDFAGIPAKWKSHLDAFCKRWDRKFGRTGVKWRMELLPRQSGASMGVMVPHFHLLQWPTKGLNRGGRVSDEQLAYMREWSLVAWNEVVGGDEDHLKAGTRVERIRSKNGVMSYASKYMSKPDSDEMLEQYPEGVGRVWGSKNKDCIPKSGVVELKLDFASTVAVMRYFREVASVPEDCAPVSLTVFHDPGRLLDNLDALIATYWPDDLAGRWVH